MSRSFELHAPDFFTAGAVGVPGQRTFYLQARESGVLVTLKVEKEQVGALAEYLGRLLSQLPAGAGDPPGDLTLREPIDPAWDVGSLGVAYDEAADRILIVAEERQEAPEERQEEESPGGEGASARFHLTRAQAGAFVGHAQEVVKAGRPACVICGRPKDPDGHVCPRSNGHLPHREEAREA